MKKLHLGAGEYVYMCMYPLPFRVALRALAFCVFSISCIATMSLKAVMTLAIDIQAGAAEYQRIQNAMSNLSKGGLRGALNEGLSDALRAEQRGGRIGSPTPPSRGSTEGVIASRIHASRSTRGCTEGFDCPVTGGHLAAVANSHRAPEGAPAHVTHVVHARITIGNLDLHYAANLASRVILFPGALPTAIARFLSGMFLLTPKQDSGAISVEIKVSQEPQELARTAVSAEVSK